MALLKGNLSYYIGSQRFFKSKLNFTENCSYVTIIAHIIICYSLYFVVITGNFDWLITFGVLSNILSIDFQCQESSDLKTRWGRLIADNIDLCDV